MDRRHHIPFLTIFAGLLLLCAWLYFPPYFDSFVGDDFVQQWRIREFVTAPADAYQILHPFWTNWYYRPLQNLWFLGNRLQFGLNPFGYYTLQILCHLLAISLLVRMVRLLRLPPWAVLATAVLFAINGQHQLTVSWISSIGIVLGAVFSLAAATTYLTYLHQEKMGWLIITFVFVMLALLAHEEGMLIIPFLLAIWLTQPRRLSRPRDIGFFILMSGLLAGYVALQLSRPNVHIAVDGDYISRLLTAVSPNDWGAFALEAVTRWLGFEGQAGNLMAQPVLTPFAGMGILIGAGLAFWAGSRAVRLGLLWAGFHLGFIYLGLWSQRPELFDGRHLYNAWIGISLALGAILAQAASSIKWTPGSRGRRGSTGVGLALALFLFLWLHIQAVQSGMTRFYQLTRQVKAAEADMKAILPEVNEQTQVFATRFLLTAQYFAPAAGVWYDDPNLKGGSLNILQKYDAVPPHFYLFDYEEGRLTNLMPELQAATKTIFLWNQEPVVTNANLAQNTIVGSTTARHLALKIVPETSGWATLHYTAEVPPESWLMTAVRGRPGQQFQILINGDVVFSYALANSHNHWQAVEIPLNQFANQTITIQFQTAGSANEPGYWSVPRLVIN